MHRYASIAGELLAAGSVGLHPNPPVNADARGHSAMCAGWPARAGYRER
jgi:hypothetical protein